MQLSNRNCPYSGVFCSQTESLCVLPHRKTSYDLLRYFSITSCIEKAGWGGGGGGVYIYRNISSLLCDTMTCIVAKVSSEY